MSDEITETSEISGKKKQGRPPKEAGVSKDEFDAKFGQLTSQITGITSILADLANSMKQPATPNVVNSARIGDNPPPSVAEAGPTPSNQVPVAPSWRELVDKTLGTDFDIIVTMPPNGGTQFTLLVPKDKSNADQQHWIVYKRDHRTREVGATGFDGVKEWCLKVRGNLIASGKTLPQYP